MLFNFFPWFSFIETGSHIIDHLGPVKCARSSHSLWYTLVVPMLGSLRQEFLLILSQVASSGPAWAILNYVSRKENVDLGRWLRR